MPAGTSGELKDVVLHSFENDGLDLLMDAFMDFSDSPYPEYEREKMALHSWNVIREGANAQVYLLAKAENPDQDFQLDSGYKVHGTALFQYAGGSGVGEPGSRLVSQSGNVRMVSEQ